MPECGLKRWLATFALFTLALIGTAAEEAPVPDGDAVLRTVARIRALSAQEAAEALPVRVSGTLTYFDRSDWKHFMEDATAGIYFSIPDAYRSDPRLTHGSRVVLEGVTSPGDYAPIVIASEIVFVGDGVLPPPRPSPVSAIVNGLEDSQWVTIRGVVQGEAELNGRTVLSLWTPEAVLKTTVPAARPAGTLVDATVEVDAVAGTVFSERLLFRGVELLVPRWSHLRVLAEAPADPHALPVQPVASLLRHHAGAGGFHRFRFEAMVTLARSDGTLLVQDASGGMSVQLRDPEGFHVQPGAVVSVVGFPTAQDRRALRNAVVKPADETRFARPEALAGERRLDERLHATLVSLEGRIVGQTENGRDDVVTVEIDGGVVDAVLERTPGVGRLERLPEGTRVALTGVYLAQFDESLRVRSFRLFLRSPLDMSVLARPAWWTLRTTLWALGALSILLVGALAWSGQLRREVHRRTRELSHEVEVRKRAERRLADETALLQAEVRERTQAEQRLKETHAQLMTFSRQAGMAEVATSVLHNVGNVLNSVNVSATLVADTARRSKAANVARLAALFEQHREDLPAFLADDPKGRVVQPYLSTLAKELEDERSLMLAELGQLRKNIDHIKDVVAMQQGFARTSGLVEDHAVVELVEDALRLNAESLVRHDVSVVRNFEARPVARLDKHKVLQVLVNLIRNAKHACDESGRDDKRIELYVKSDGDRVEISVADNGVGVAPENLTRIFSYGFTTRAHGHGFGLHSGALAASELGGTLSVHSDGPGCGATFVLTFPLNPNSASP
jgi:signal transduction histidine kinase